MTFPDGEPKGMKATLKERGVDTKRMKAADMRAILKSHPDFQNQKTLLEEFVEGRGHICLYYITQNFTAS